MIHSCCPDVSSEDKNTSKAVLGDHVYKDWTFLYPGRNDLKGNFDDEPQVTQAHCVCHVT